MKDVAVVKLSGKALGAQKELTELFVALKNTPAVVIHGGGVEVDELFAALNLKVEKKHGLRVSPAEHMPYICAALAGQCNKHLQSVAQAAGLQALGLLSSDGSLLKVSKLSEDLGMVGKVVPGDPSFIQMLLERGMTPILCSLCMDDKGQIFNVNADDVAAAVASLLKAPLYFISDVKGVLDGNKELVPELSEDVCQKMVTDGIISAGMAVKVNSAFKAAQATLVPVYIGSIFDPSLSSAICARRRLGTALIV